MDAFMGSAPFFYPWFRLLFCFCGMKYVLFSPYESHYFPEQSDRLGSSTMNEGKRHDTESTFAQKKFTESTNMQELSTIITFVRLMLHAWEVQNFKIGDRMSGGITTLHLNNFSLKIQATDSRVSVAVPSLLLLVVAYTLYPHVIEQKRRRWCLSVEAATSKGSNQGFDCHLAISRMATWVVLMNVGTIRRPVNESAILHTCRRHRCKSMRISSAITKNRKKNRKLTANWSQWCKHKHNLCQSSIYNSLSPRVVLWRRP